MWHQKAKGPPDGPPIFLIFVEKLNCPQSQAYQSISPVGTGLSLTDRALGVSLGTSIGNYSPLIAPQPVKLKIHCQRWRAGSSPAAGTIFTKQKRCHPRKTAPQRGFSAFKRPKNDRHGMTCFGRCHPDFWDLNRHTDQNQAQRRQQKKKFLRRLTGKNLWVFSHFWTNFQGGMTGCRALQIT